MAMDEAGLTELSAASRDLIENGDVTELTYHVNGLVLDQKWDELTALRQGCHRAFERGKQLWAVAAFVEYRLCLQAPGPWAALMLETGTGRFALGPLPEVAASGHTWAELSPHLHLTPQAAMAAHERVVRGDDLSGDASTASLPEVLDLPFRLEPWEPSYAVAEYHADRLVAAPPVMAPLEPSLGGAPAGPRPPRNGATGTGHQRDVEGGQAQAEGGQAQADDVSSALEELVSTWTTQSNGRAEAVSVKGTALDAISAMGAQVTELIELAPATALAMMAWAASNGGAHGRRAGAAPGRFAAWWVVATLGGLTDQWPLRADDVGEALNGARWYQWTSNEPIIGWSLHLAVEASSGPRAGRAWVLAAGDQA